MYENGYSMARVFNHRSTATSLTGNHIFRPDYFYWWICDPVFPGREVSLSTGHKDMILFFPFVFKIKLFSNKEYLYLIGLQLTCVSFFLLLA